MRYLLMGILLLSFSAGPLKAGWCQGPAGNRTIGVVYEKLIAKDDTESSQPSEGATVSILNRDVNDDTNSDGLYYIILPDDLQEFQLVAKKTGYQTARPEEKYRNDRDPVEANRIELEPLDEDSPYIRGIVDREIAIYNSAASRKVRGLIIADLTDLIDRVSDEVADYIREQLARLPKP